MASSTIKIIVNQETFDVPEDLVKFIGKTLGEIID